MLCCAQYVNAQGICQGKSKDELIRLLILIIGSAATDTGDGASFECAEVVDLPELATELLRMLLSLYGAFSAAFEALGYRKPCPLGPRP